MMALPQIISRNQIQRIPTTLINLRKVLSGGTDGDFYTCPTSKKAIIKGTAVCTGLGAAATVNLLAGGVELCDWDVAGNIGTNNLTVGTFFPFEIQLAAGDILQYTQNTGTNGEMQITAEILETPA